MAAWTYAAYVWVVATITYVTASNAFLRHHSPCDEALSNAMKVFRAMRDEGNTGDLKHESEEFNFHLTQCPVCQFGKRALRMNYDGCFKLRQMKTAEKADAPPIGRRSPFRVL